jgi:Fe-S oxidoreductase
VGIAAVHAMEQAGFRVRIPRRTLCCGRPLYDYGMLDMAKRLLRGILGHLSEEIAEGTPVVVLEPSCLAVFRDELVNLFPHDLQARRLSRQASSLSEFLTRRAPSYDPPTLRRKAIVHGHCHQKAVLGMDAERRLYERMGLEATLLDSGCCGMAGSFGFERDHHAISLAIAEHELLPAVRAADRDTIVVADGFSCREQIAQTTDRRALHTAEVLAMALRDGPGGPSVRPESLDERR